MAKPFSALPGIIEKHRKALLMAVDDIARSAALAAGQRAVLATRVDTGLARSNWQATINSPASSVIPAYAPGMKRGIGERANSFAAQAQHASVAVRWKPTSGKVFYITNNVSYSFTLNFGGPTVSAGNMLAQARLAWIASVKKPRKILNTRP